MNQKIKILFVEYCADLKGGGAQRVFLNILNSINKEKFEIYAAYPNIVNGELTKELPDYVKKIDYDSKSPDTALNRVYAYLRFLIFIPLILIKWFFVIKREGISVVYVHSIISGLHFSILRIFLRFKLIYHEHNMASQRPKTLLWRMLFKFVVNKADLIIAISKDVKKSLVEYGVAAEKIKLIHNGIQLQSNLNLDEITHRGYERMPFAQEEGAVIVGLVGHFRPWKGQKIFVESLKYIQSDQLNIKYVLIGGVHDSAYYEDILQYISHENISDRVFIMGHQDNVEELMSCMDIVVVPSTPEPFGLVILEAMMLKKPVVAFNMGGPAEIIVHNKTGILVDNVSSQDLSKAILALISDKNSRIKLGEAGRELLELKYTTLIQCENIENEIMEVLNN